MSKMNPRKIEYRRTLRILEEHWVIIEMGDVVMVGIVLMETRLPVTR